jgi:L-ascorbate metabolism protein UlaG (beta-lactamase superfamily)
MGLTYTFHGHACFTLASDDATLLFDPFLTGNPAAKATADQLAADYILLSHGHFDHMPDTVSIAQRTGATVIGTLELATWMNNQARPMSTACSRAARFAFPLAGSS